MGDWTIGKRIIAGGVALVGLLLVVGGVAVTTLGHLQSLAGARMRDDAITGVTFSADMSAFASRSYINAFMAGEPAGAPERDECMKQSLADEEKVGETMKLYEAAITDGDDRRNFESLTQLRSLYMRACATYFSLIKASKKEEASAWQLQKLHPSFVPYLALLSTMLEANKEDAVLAANEMIETARRAKMVASAASVGAVLIAVMLGCIVIRGTNRSLRQIASTLNDASAHVSSASAHFSASSQELAAGASEQAASLEETAASLEEISSMTRCNAESANKARAIANETSQATEIGAHQMGEMVKAMSAIKISSANIAKIIKTIDEIAFQTNILALNAAVEAARAGEAGAGFAVVADEVRALAHRAAQAARETTDKIDDSIAKSAHGAEISATVAEGLKQIAIKARQVNELVVGIASGSQEQNEGLAQIGIAVSRIDKHVQKNAVSADDAAEAAVDLNSEADSLKGTVGKLLQLVGGEKKAKLPDKSTRQVVATVPAKTAVTLRLDGLALQTRLSAPSRRQDEKRKEPAVADNGSDYFSDS